MSNIKSRILTSISLLLILYFSFENFLVLLLTLFFLTFLLLDEFNNLNGATRVLPKSHLKDSFPIMKKKYSNEKYLTGKKGSVIIFNAAMWHGSSKKLTDQERWGMIFSYSKWFLKPSFDYNKNTPLKIYNKLNSYQKELLGFKFNPPKDEFSRSSSRSKKPEKPLY